MVDDDEHQKYYFIRYIKNGFSQLPWSSNLLFSATLFQFIQCLEMVSIYTICKKIINDIWNKCHLPFSEVVL
jgi:hypothetical protein